MSSLTLSAPESLQRYGVVARALHWAIVALIVVEYPLAWSMPDHRGDNLSLLSAAHIAVGTTLLSLMVLRLAWRLLRRPPPEVPMPRWQALAARWTHRLLYAGFLLLPLLGWMAASAREWPVTWAGLVALPALAPANQTLAGWIGDVHQVLALALLGLIGLHVLAALFHHFVLRDGTLRRML